MLGGLAFCLGKRGSVCGCCYRLCEKTSSYGIFCTSDSLFFTYGGMPKLGLHLFGYLGSWCECPAMTITLARLPLALMRGNTDKEKLRSTQKGGLQSKQQTCSRRKWPQILAPNKAKFKQRLAECDYDVRRPGDQAVGPKRRIVIETCFPCATHIGGIAV